jgi:hypothetical protein
VYGNSPGLSVITHLTFAPSEAKQKQKKWTSKSFSR